MKKRILSLFFALAMVISLMPMPSRGAAYTYFLGINDDLPQLTQQTAPIKVGGVTYVPYTIFSSAVVGAYLGISYIWSPSSLSLTLYGGQKVLEFDMDAGTAYSFVEDKTYNYVAVYQNGMAYVPIGVVARYFGISCSFLNTEDLNYQILRLCNGQQSKDNKSFVRAVSPVITERVGADKEESSGGDGGQVTPPPTPPPTVPEEEEKEGKNKYSALAFLSLDSETIESVLALLESYPQGKSLFFFTEEELVSKWDSVLRIVTQGHKIGLIPEGETLEEQRESIERCNGYLWHIGRKKSLILLSGEALSNNASELLKEGYVIYKTSFLEGEGLSEKAYADKAKTTLRYGGQKTTLLFDDAVTRGTLIRVLKYIGDEEYMLIPVREI